MDCSHGPGDSEWGAIEGKHVPRLREAVLHHVGIDIYLQEGRWFPDPAFCRRHGIPVMLCRQRPGDVIVLKGDTVHWVRSAGHAVNTSWNFGALDDAAQLRTAVDRMRVNTAIGFRNLVPVHTLALDMSTVILGSCGMLALRSAQPGSDAKSKSMLMESKSKVMSGTCAVSTDVRFSTESWSSRIALSESKKSSRVTILGATQIAGGDTVAKIGAPNMDKTGPAKYWPDTLECIHPSRGAKDSGAMVVMDEFYKQYWSTALGC